MNYVNSEGIPIGLGMALAQNQQAMEQFARLPDTQKQAVIDGTHQIRSKEQMQAYVANLFS